MEDKRESAKTIVVSMAVIAVLMGVMVLCLVSAVQKLEPVNMPFGVVGSSQVVAGVEDKVSLDTTTYTSESDARAAVERGDVYGAYVPGTAGDTLILAQAKSFFAGVELTAIFESAAEAGQAAAHGRQRGSPAAKRPGRRRRPDCCSCRRSSADTSWR